MGPGAGEPAKNRRQGLSRVVLPEGDSVLLDNSLGRGGMTMTKTDALKAIKIIFEWLSSRSADPKDRLVASDLDELRMRLSGLMSRLG